MTRSSALPADHFSGETATGAAPAAPLASAGDARASEGPASAAMERLADTAPLAPTQQIATFAPASGEQVWRGPVGDVDGAVERARRGWSEWAARPLANRIELLRRFANEVRREADPLATLIAQETGKPAWDAKDEADRVIAGVEHAIRAYAERSGQRRFDSALSGRTAVRHKPHGVLAVITPFNNPAHIPAARMVPALLAGNAVVFKPSEKAIGTGEVLIRCFQRAGIPASVVQLCPGGPEHGQTLVAHDGIDGVLFTGSARVGIGINRRLAARPDRLVSLEMGGNNAIVVTDTPLVRDAAVLVIQSAFLSSGQRCTAARRLIVTESMAEALLAEVKALADRLIVGRPFDEPAPFMGPVVDNRAADTLTESFLYLLSHGAKPIKHLVRLDDATPLLSPAIIDVTGMAQRPDVELFGPVLQVVRVPDLDAAIAEANATRFGLTASLIGGSPQDYNRFWANVRCGVVNWNRPTTGPNDSVPMGGTGLSGNHRPGGAYLADTVAYPVASGELDQPRAMINVGLGDEAAR